MVNTVKKTPSYVLSTEASDSVQLYKALGDELRLSILSLLRSESFGVLELSSILEIKQSALSHHLKILANAGLVATRREGNSIFYRRAFLGEDDSLFPIKRSAFHSLDSSETSTLPASVQRRIKRIQLERAQSSLHFFNRNVDRFRENQELITQLPEYENTIFELIDSLPVNGDSQTMEIGPGEGLLLTKLAQRFQNLVALDNSKEMLELAKETTTAEGHSHIKFLLGDSMVAIKQRLSCDLIIASMVLHHISSPANTFNDIAKILKPGGSLLLVDLCHHDQDWVRNSCGDLWLGFEPEALDLWARQASLNVGQSVYLGLRNGFQVQLRLFHQAL